MFADPEVSRQLAFRGGTALYKLHLRPPARYSEDIDLVQVTAGPIGGIFDAIRRTLDPWLGTPRRTASEGRIDLIYRMSSEEEPPIPMRLKVEINSREHFTVFGFEEREKEGSRPLRPLHRWPLDCRFRGPCGRVLQPLP